MFSITHDCIGAIAKFIPEIVLPYPLLFFLSFFEAQNHECISVLMASFQKALNSTD